MPFVDRAEAGRRLAERLDRFRGTDVVVLGLPRGGVPVAAQVARALAAPLDVIVVRKLGLPGQPELAMGAIGEGGTRVLNTEVLSPDLVGADELAEVERIERAELDRRVKWVRRDHPRIPVSGRTALIVDDGIATGATARAACLVARGQGARRVVMAAPVAATDVVEALLSVADEVVCVDTPRYLGAVGQWYADFAPTSDQEVMALLDDRAHFAQVVREGP